MIAIFSKYEKGNNSYKKSSNVLKVELDLKLFILKLHTNFEFNSSKHDKKSLEN